MLSINDKHSSLDIALHFSFTFPTTRGFLEADSDTQQASISAHPIDVRWDSGPEAVAAMPTHTYPSPVSISWLFLRCVSGRCLVERSWNLSPFHNIPSFAPAHFPISCSTAPHRVPAKPAQITHSLSCHASPHYHTTAAVLHRRLHSSVRQPFFLRFPAPNSIIRAKSIDFGLI